MGTSATTARAGRAGGRKAAAVLTAAAIALLAGACSDGGGSSSGGSTSANTVTTESGKPGKVLAGGAKGESLYVFLKDTTSRSTCSGGCAKAWPPMTVEKQPVAKNGAQKGLLGTSTRGDGSKQVTYKGRPLYFFQGDAKSGQTNGQGLDQFGAKWYVVGTDGKVIKSKNGGGGGGY